MQEELFLEIRKRIVYEKEIEIGKNEKINLNF